MQHFGHGADSSAVWVGEDRCSNSGTLRLLPLRHKNQGLLFLELAGKNTLSLSHPLLTSLHFLHMQAGGLTSNFGSNCSLWKLILAHDWLVGQLEELEGFWRCLLPLIATSKLNLATDCNAAFWPWS